MNHSFSNPAFPLIYNSLSDLSSCSFGSINDSNISEKVFDLRDANELLVFYFCKDFDSDSEKKEK